MAGGPEIAELHQKAAQLFQEWLAEEKAAQAEAEKRRKQEALDNVSCLLCCLFLVRLLITHWPKRTGTSAFELLHPASWEDKRE